MTVLAAGAAVTTVVPARDRWVHTGIGVVAGATYDMVASGCWVDFYIPSDPSGYSLPLFGRGRRVNAAPLFALIGAVGENEAATFCIGKAWRGSVASDGELCCFANDLPGMYWNNWGKVTLTVKRL